MLRFLYDLLLVGPGLDVPDDPSQTAVDIVHWFALIGSVLELLAGAVVLALARRRGPWREEGAAVRGDRGPAARL